jgi:hypothetical protein
MQNNGYAIGCINNVLRPLIPKLDKQKAQMKCH